MQRRRNNNRDCKTGTLGKGTPNYAKALIPIACECDARRHHICTQHPAPKQDSQMSQNTRLHRAPFIDAFISNAVGNPPLAFGVGVQSSDASNGVTLSLLKQASQVSLPNRQTGLYNLPLELLRMPEDASHEPRWIHSAAVSGDRPCPERCTSAPCAGSR